MSRVAVVLIAITIAFCGSRADASPILATTAGWNLEGQSCSASGTTVANCTQNIAYTWNGFPAGGNVVAQSNASFGQLSLNFSTVGLQGGMNTGHVLTGSASFADELTISGGTGSGYVQYLFAGHVQVSTEGFNGPNFQISHDGTSVLAYQAPGNSGFSSALAYVSPLFSFDWDDPFQFSASMTQLLSNGACCSNQTGIFSMGLSEIRVFDAAGNAVAFSLAHAGEAPNVTAVPEPSALILVGSGLLAVRRRRAASAAVQV